MPDRWTILLILLGLTAFLAMVWTAELCKKRKHK